jgi:hypothetical protein
VIRPGESIFIVSKWILLHKHKRKPVAWNWEKKLQKIRKTQIHFVDSSHYTHTNDCNDQGSYSFDKINSFIYLSGFYVVSWIVTLGESTRTLSPEKILKWKNLWKKWKRWDRRFLSASHFISALASSTFRRSKILMNYTRTSRKIRNKKFEWKDEVVKYILILWTSSKF